MSERISVIIPAFNHEKYIAEAVRSVIRQTYGELELILIDDGSADGTRACLEEIEDECRRRFVRTVFKSRENRGTCRTLNEMLDLAQGEYICPCASDDCLKPRMIETLHACLAGDDGCVLAVGDNDILDGEGRRIFWDAKRNAVPREQAVFMTFGDFLGLNNAPEGFEFGSYKNLLKRNHLPNGALIRKESLLKAGKYRPDIPLEDWYMNLQLAKQGKMKYAGDILYSYRWHGGNTVVSAAYRRREKETFRRIYDHEREYCLTHGYAKVWKACRRKQSPFFSALSKLRHFLLTVRLKKDEKTIRLFGIYLLKRHKR